jgi:hypothetical protein
MQAKLFLHFHSPKFIIQAGVSATGEDEFLILFGDDDEDE